MNRFDVILKIDHACSILEEAMELMQELGASFLYKEDMQSIVRRLEDYRIEVHSASLPNESEEQ